MHCPEGRVTLFPGGHCPWLFLPLPHVGQWPGRRQGKGSSGGGPGARAHRGGQPAAREGHPGGVESLGRHCRCVFGWGSQGKAVDLQGKGPQVLGEGCGEDERPYVREADGVRVQPLHGVLPGRPCEGARGVVADAPLHRAIVEVSRWYSVSHTRGLGSLGGQHHSRHARGVLRRGQGGVELHAVQGVLGGVAQAAGTTMRAGRGWGLQAQPAGGAAEEAGL
mmetsp:Transcript_37470/g.116535  ORF Transcript_37470/g.116535 Transcript_37470/m.116535 type:complete len:222 (+) Transcript_37470:468-1133(+)